MSRFLIGLIIGAALIFVGAYAIKKNCEGFWCKVFPWQKPPVVIRYDSGITGQVLLGPTCPIERTGDSGCDDRPYQTKVLVYAAQDSYTPVAETKADVSGN